jgi:hypothetical protein
MIVALLTATLLVALAFCFALERTIRRERVEAAAALAASRTEIAAELAASRAETAAERDRAAIERKELYQRIQAPELAVAEAHRERRGPYKRRQPIGADNDQQFAERNGGEAGDRG